MRETVLENIPQEGTNKRINYKEKCYSVSTKALLIKLVILKHEVFASYFDVRNFNFI